MINTEVQKIRHERLRLVCRKALEQSIEKSLGSCEIKLCYPIIGNTIEGSKSLEIARKQIIKFWYDNSINEFELIFKERNIESKLDELDEIIQNAQKRKQTNGKSIFLDKMTSNNIVIATLLSQGKEFMNNLNEIHCQLEKENETLYEELKDTEKEALKIKEVLEASMNKIKDDFKMYENENNKKKLDELVETFVKSNCYKI